MRPDNGRRWWLLGAASLALTACSKHGCNHSTSGGPAQVDTSEVQLHEVTFDASHGGPQKAAVMVPRWGPAGTRYPLLIALHGRGEANRGLDVGAWGWIRDYWLDRTFVRLRHPPLRSDDLLDIATPTYLAKLNQRLARRPFRGLVVVCPHTPDILATRDLDAAASFASFLTRHLIEEVRHRFPVIPEAHATGIDGVSLGGRMALLVAAEQPSAFGVVGSLQAAIHKHEVREVAARLTRAWKRNDAPRRVRLLTSEGDFFRSALRTLAETLEPTGMPICYDEVPGSHDYEFNRGPGGYEMLSWHDAVLRGPEATSECDMKIRVSD